ncbi:hypothetical protein HMI55_004970, partial [Coelomomyces lativittatus]
MPKEYEDSACPGTPVVDEAFLNEILQLDVNVTLKLPYTQTNAIPSKSVPPNLSPTAEASPVNNSKKIGILLPGDSTTTMTNNLNRAQNTLQVSKNDLWHREIISRWKAKLGLQNVKYDLREKHLLSFYHSNF